MRIVIVGCGYVGMALASFWQGADLTVTTTSPSRIEELTPLGKVVLLDSSDLGMLNKLLLDADRVVVCVAPKNGDYSVYSQTAANICKAIPRSTHLIYTSSSSVYGDCGGEWVDESSPLKGNAHLIEAEKLYSTLPNSTILRLSGIYGPRRGLESFAKRIAGTKQSDSYTNWVCLEDIVNGINFAFKKKLMGIYNLCSDAHPKRSDVFNQMIASLNLQSVLWKEGQTRFGSKRVSNKKIKQEGFTFCGASLFSS
jgi:nucleoside-diphosphate-sugar epimerase